MFNCCWAGTLNFVVLTDSEGKGDCWKGKEGIAEYSFSWIWYVWAWKKWWEGSWKVVYILKQSLHRSKSWQSEQEYLTPRICFKQWLQKKSVWI